MNHLSFHDYASKQIALKQMQDISPLDYMFSEPVEEPVESFKHIQVQLILPLDDADCLQGVKSNIDETMSLIEEMYRDFVDIHLSYLGLNVEDLVNPIQFDRESAYKLLYREVIEHLIGNYDTPSERNGDTVTTYSIDFYHLAELITEYGEPRFLCNVFYYVWWFGRGIEDGEEVTPAIDWFYRYMDKVTNESWEVDDSTSRETGNLLNRISEGITDFHTAITNPYVSIQSAIIELVNQGVLDCPIETKTAEGIPLPWDGEDTPSLSEQDSHIPTEPDDVPWEVEEVA